MSNRNYPQEELRSVLAGFGIKDPTDVARYGSGHINDTFKVETASGIYGVFADTEVCITASFSGSASRPVLYHTVHGSVPPAVLAAGSRLEGIAVNLYHIPA